MTGKTILITGASSGIGEAIAKECEARGYALALVARRQTELERVQQEIQAQHADTRVEIAALDVTNYGEIPVVFDDLKGRLGEIDTVFVNAGISRLGMIGEGCFEEYKCTIETNLIGALATVDKAVSYFQQRGGGHVVTISSVAAWRGMPGALAYCAAKTGLDRFMESARGQFVYDRKMKFTHIFPGFVNTPMVEDVKMRPFEISPERAAKKMLNGVERGARYVYVPWFPWRILKPFFTLSPNWLVNLVARLQ